MNSPEDFRGNDPLTGSQEPVYGAAATGSAGAAAEPGAYAETHSVPPAGAYGVPPVGEPYGPAYPGPFAGPVPGPPNPALAGLLGLIPGVGAMYNGQFAKGIAHIAIFAVLSSLSKDVNGIFGLFVAGWVFYMVIEAYHTARARRDGLPLPNPFGLNEIGERLGFGHGPNWSEIWGHSRPVPPSGTAPGAAQGPIQNPSGSGAPERAAAATAAAQASAAAARAREAAAAAQRSYVVDPYGHVSHEPWAQPYDPYYNAPRPGTPTGQPYASTYVSGSAAVPPVGGYPPSPYGYGAPPVYPPPPPASSVPTGAIWLIGLGVLALLGSIHPFGFLEGESLGGIFLMVLGVLVFAQRYWADRHTYPAGSAAANMSYLRAGKGAGSLIIIGLLTLLQGLHIAYWSSTWPILLIFLGVWILLERVAQNRMAVELHAHAMSSPVPPMAGPGAPPPTQESQDPARASFRSEQEGH